MAVSHGGSDYTPGMFYISSSHANTHTHGGSDEIDGDRLDIDYLPYCYYPTTAPAEVTSLEELTAHLAGIDDKLCEISSSTKSHSDLTDLDHINDHLLYLDLAGIRSMSGNLDMGTQDIINVNLVDGVDVSSHFDRHEYNGVDEIDGDHLDIDFIPSHYVPDASISEADYSNHLSAHLAGIDQSIVTASLFGSEYHFSESCGIFSTTATFFQQAHTCKTAFLPEGVYRIMWFYIWSYDDIKSNIKIRVQLDDTQELLDPYHIQEPNDSQGPGNGGTDQRFVASGMSVENLSSGSHAIDIDILSEIPGISSTIYIARIELFRIM